MLANIILLSICVAVTMCQTPETNRANFVEPYVFEYEKAENCGTNGEANLNECIGRTKEFCQLSRAGNGEATGTFDYDWHFNSCMDNWHRVCCKVVVVTGQGDFNDAAKARLHFLQYVIKGMEIPEAWKRNAALMEMASRFAR